MTEGIHLSGVNGFSLALHGLDEALDPEQLSDKILDYLAWTAVAGEVNNELPDGDQVDVPLIHRAYPIIQDMIERNLSTRDVSVSETDAKKLVSTADKFSPDFQQSVDYMLGLSETSDVVQSLAGQVNEQVLGHPLACCVFKPETGDGSLYSWTAVHKLRGIRYKEYNEYLGRPGGNLILFQQTKFNCKTNALTNTRIAVQEVAPNRYSVVVPRRVKTPVLPETRKTVSEHIDYAYALAFRRRYEWEVEFALTPQRSGLVISTDCEGVKTLLMNRDQAPKGRKAALVHWVRAHHRRKSKVGDESDLAFVRKHFRGRLECEYGGMHCRIYPSQFDLDAACNGARIAKKIDRVESL